MSFILDALRKSETARRRSEAPDLFANMSSAVEPVRARPVWPAWTIGGVGVLSLIAALWLFVMRTPDRPVAVVAAESSTAPSPTMDAAVPLLTTNEPAPLPPAPAPVAPPIAPRTPSPVQTAAPTAPVETTNPRELRAPPLEIPVTPPPASSSSTAAPPGGGQTVALADLEPNARKQLPSLKLSMHLWNETPSQRFVILDGQRLKEGDVLGEIVIEQITRDGALLNWRGGRLKIELR